MPLGLHYHTLQMRRRALRLEIGRLALQHVPAAFLSSAGFDAQTTITRR